MASITTVIIVLIMLLACAGCTYAGYFIGCRTPPFSDLTIDEYRTLLIDEYRTLFHEAEERGRRQVYENMDYVLKHSVNGTLTSTDVLEQPQTEVPQEVLMAHGVRTVSELPPAVRAVWDKDYRPEVTD